MSPKGSMFFDEWQECLRAHYLHVLHTRDWVTEPTLRRVLLNTGLTEDDLAALQAEAEFSTEQEPDTEPDVEPEPMADLPLAEIDETGDELVSSDEWDDDDLLRGDPEAEVYDAEVYDAALDEDAPLDDMAEADFPDEDALDAEQPPYYEPPPSQLSLF